MFALGLDAMFLCLIFRIFHAMNAFGDLIFKLSKYVLRNLGWYLPKGLGG